MSDAVILHELRPEPDDALSRFVVSHPSSAAADAKDGVPGVYRSLSILKQKFAFVHALVS